MINRLIAVILPLPTPRSSAAVPSASPGQPIPPGAEATVADWIAAWAQVGAAVGTVLTLIAALWINRRTRMALDDERLTRQQEIARLDADALEARSKLVLRTAHDFIDAVLSVRAADLERAAVTSVIPHICFLVSGVSLASAFIADLDRDEDSAPETLWSDRAYALAGAAVGSAFAVPAWRGVGKALGFRHQAAERMTRVELAFREIQQHAHPEVIKRATVVFEATRMLASREPFLRPTPEQKGAMKLVESSLRELRSYILSEPVF